MATPQVEASVLVMKNLWPALLLLLTNYRGHDVDLKIGGRARACCELRSMSLGRQKASNRNCWELELIIQIRRGHTRHACWRWNLVSGREGSMAMIAHHNQEQENFWKVMEAVRVDEDTKYCIECHWQFGITTQCCIYFAVCLTWYQQVSNRLYGRCRTSTILLGTRLHQ